MRKTKRTAPSKLKLNREAIRILTAESLIAVDGANKGPDSEDLILICPVTPAR
jgi:hypothetical protein